MWTEIGSKMIVSIKIMNQYSKKNFEDDHRSGRGAARHLRSGEAVLWPCWSVILIILKILFFLNTWGSVVPKCTWIDVELNWMKHCREWSFESAHRICSRVHRGKSERKWANFAILLFFLLHTPNAIGFFVQCVLGSIQRDWRHLFNHYSLRIDYTECLPSSLQQQSPHNMPYKGVSIAGGCRKLERGGSQPFFRFR